MSKQNDNKPESPIMQQLHDPARMRIAVCLLMLMVGYMGIYSPLQERITQKKRQLKQEETRRDLAINVGNLRKELTKIDSRIPEAADVNEWMQYVLGGVRESKLTLKSITPGALRSVGPMQAVELSVALEGEYLAFDSFLVWLETNDRLFRVDSVKVTPTRDASTDLQMQVKVLGLTGKS